MPSPETQRVEEIRKKLNKVYLRLAYGKSNVETAKKEVDEILNQDRQHILEVLTQAIYDLEGDYESKNPDTNWIKAVPTKSLIALLQETLGEGKEINSIFKE